MQIDLSKYNPNTRALTGTDRGYLTYMMIESDYDLKQLESLNKSIEIIIPDSIVTINISFFIGMFETIIDRLGKDKFESIYSFKCSGHIVEKIPKYIMKVCEEVNMNLKRVELRNEMKGWC